MKKNKKKKRNRKKKKLQKIITGQDPNVSSGSLYMRKRGLPDEEKKGIKKKISNQKRRQEDKQSKESEE